MKVIVEFTNDAHTKARITLVPGWLGRLLGRRVRAGDAESVGGSWRWSTTMREVGARVRSALETQDVEPLPVARVPKRLSKEDLAKIRKVLDQ